MIKELGREVPQDELLDVFPPAEGELHMYYGQIGSGKTYGATYDAIEDAKRGAVVYTTWPIKVADFDDRESAFMVIINNILFRKRHYKIPLEQNIHFIDVETGTVDRQYAFSPDNPRAYIEYLNSLSHCIIYIDEAWRVIDSYTPVRDFGLEVRSLLLVTRHKFRTIKLITQRPTAVQVTARANVNRFFKFVKIASWPFIRFGRYEFQEMSGDTVNEQADPISVKTYWGSKRIFNAYNSYYYGGNSQKHKLSLQAFDLNFKHRIQAFFNLFKKRKSVDKSVAKKVSSEVPF